jgi:hypothetical protein
VPSQPRDPGTVAALLTWGVLAGPTLSPAERRRLGRGATRIAAYGDDPASLDALVAALARGHEAFPGRLPFGSLPAHRTPEAA